jgi:hypothetical protein
MEVGMQVLGMTNRLIIVTISAKYFQNLLNYKEVFFLHFFTWGPYASSHGTLKVP